MGAFGSSLLVTLNAGMPASSSMTCTRKKKNTSYFPPLKKNWFTLWHGSFKGVSFWLQG
jgi:hypothetical protein